MAHLYSIPKKIIMSNEKPSLDSFYHHGVLGQKWGKKNGPPYPLDAGDHSASERKAGYKKSIGGGRNEELYSRRKSHKLKNPTEFDKADAALESYAAKRKPEIFKRAAELAIKDGTNPKDIDYKNYQIVGDGEEHYYQQALYEDPTYLKLEKKALDAYKKDKDSWKNKKTQLKSSLKKDPEGTVKNISSDIRKDKRYKSAVQELKDFHMAYYEESDKIRDELLNTKKFESLKDYYNGKKNITDGNFDPRLELELSDAINRKIKLKPEEGIEKYKKVDAVKKQLIDSKLGEYGDLKMPILLGDGKKTRLLKTSLSKSVYDNLNSDLVFPRTRKKTGNNN